MILVVDLGNSNIVFGLYDRGTLLTSWRMPTERHQSEDFYALQISNYIQATVWHDIPIEGVMLSSVVPPLTYVVMTALQKLTKTLPVLLQAGIKTGLKVKSENPNEVGADLVAGSVAAIRKYGYPCVVVDLGTATKLSIIDKDGAFVGALIAPGIKIAVNALVQMATQLPHIQLIAPAKVIGKNTPDSMNSAIIYGTADMIDGLTRRIEEELGYPLTIVGTGGLAPRVLPYCRSKIVIDEHLLLDGLYDIYMKNQKGK